MKLQYEEIQINFVMLDNKDVLVTISGFDGAEDGFTNPNSTSDFTEG